MKTKLEATVPLKIEDWMALRDLSYESGSDMRTLLEILHIVASDPQLKQYIGERLRSPGHIDAYPFVK